MGACRFRLPGSSFVGVKVERLLLLLLLDFAFTALRQGVASTSFAHEAKTEATMPTQAFR